jgi:uroporphyrinogen-III synthase
VHGGNFKMTKNLPLTGLCVLVGRARHQASALSSGLRARGARILEIPFIEIRRPRSYKPLDKALHNLRQYDWLIFTSVNGVEATWQRLQKLRVTRAQMKHLKVAAIGPATSKALEQRGVRVDVVPEEYVAEFVVESLRHRVKGKRILLARARVARDVIPRELRKLGAQVDVVAAYETVIPEKSRKRLQAVLRDSKRCPDVITFTSASTVCNFLALLGNPVRHGRPPLRTVITASLPGIRFASIGPVTSSTLRQAGLPVDIEARKYTMPGLIEAIVRFTTTANRRPMKSRGR